jgi:GxxExxY protein
MEQALTAGTLSAKGMLNVPLFAFSEARRVVEERAPAAETASSPGLIQDAPYAELTRRIIGWAMAVHNEHGPGHEEAVYQRALAVQMDAEQVSSVEEPTIAVENKDGELVGLYYPDFIVEEVVVVEIKAHGWPLTNDEVAQTIDYFAGTDCNVALLFNFGQPRLTWKRLFPPKKIQEHRRKQWGKPLK